MFWKKSLNSLAMHTICINWKKNRFKGPVLIGLEEIVQRQVGVGWVGRGEVGRGR